MSEIVVVDAEQASLWDEIARTEAKIPGRVLMESAGRACAVVISEEFGAEARAGVAVVAGPGNNGGDGWVVARALAAGGFNVTAVSVVEAQSPDCIANRKLALESGVVETDSLGEVGRIGVIVDAILGTGASGPLRDSIRPLVDQMYAHGAPIVAVDGPTGVDLTSGMQSGDISAALTVTFGGLRRGHLFNRTACGKVVVVDIGFPSPQPDWPRLATDGWARKVLPPFSADMHKGDRGRVVVIGGGDGMSGAAIHAVRSCFAAGAGLIKLVSSVDTIAAAKESVPDVMTIVTDFDKDPGQEILEAIDWADSLVVGPGIGVTPARARFVEKLLNAVEVPVALDAGGLQGVGAGFARIAEKIVATPHVGEFRQMFPDIDIKNLGSFEASRLASERLGCTVLLKGVPTVITSGEKTFVVASGNPALATGGSGDVLAGIIGAFLARRVDPACAAALGAHALGRAAELAVVGHGVRTTRPDHVVSHLPDYWRVLETPSAVSVPVLFKLEPPTLT